MAKYYHKATTEIRCVGYFAHPFVKRMGLLLFSAFFSQLWFFTDEGRKSISCIYKHSALPHPCLFRNTALFHTHEN
jgi:hypothetical protein